MGGHWMLLLYLCGSMRSRCGDSSSLADCCLLAIPLKEAPGCPSPLQTPQHARCPYNGRKYAVWQRASKFVHFNLFPVCFEASTSAMATAVLRQRLRVPAVRHPKAELTKCENGQHTNTQEAAHTSVLQGRSASVQARSP